MKLINNFHKCFLWGLNFIYNGLGRYVAFDLTFLSNLLIRSGQNKFKSHSNQEKSNPIQIILVIYCLCTLVQAKVPVKAIRIESQKSIRAKICCPTLHFPRCDQRRAQRQLHIRKLKQLYRVPLEKNGTVAHAPPFSRVHLSISL